MLSKVGEAGHGGRPLCKSLEGVITGCNYTDQTPALLSRRWARMAVRPWWAPSSPSAFHLLFLHFLLLSHLSLFLPL